MDLSALIFSNPFLAQLWNDQIFFSAFLVVLGAVLLMAFLYILRSIMHARGHASKAFHKTILLIKVPKEKKSDSSSHSGEDSLSQVREQIGVADTLFSAIAGLSPEHGFGAWLHGRTDNFAFEIVTRDNLICFYVAVPYRLRELVEQQVHAQYPHAEISEEPDYNIFKPHCHIVGAHLWFKYKSAFPFKTYKGMESDPLVAVLNPLSKIGEDEGAIVQFIVRPAGGHWRREGVHIIREIKEGQKFESVAHRGSFGSFMAELKKFTGTTKSSDPNKQREKYQLTQMEEEMVKHMEEKLSHGGLEITIRIVSSAPNKESAQLNLENIINSFSQYNIYRYGNSFGAAVPKKPGDIIRASIFRSFDEKHHFVVSTEEMTSFWHLPTSSTETPHIAWLGARKAPPPTNMPSEGIVLGRCLYRGEETIVRMNRADRRRHLYTIGRSGSGKSVFIQNLAVQDIQNGEGVCIIDPHGDFVEYVLQHIPKDRVDDVIYFSPADIDRPIGLNMLEVKTEEQKDFATQEMIAIFYKLVTDPSMIGPMFEHNMRNVMLTLMADIENPGTIAEIPRMFTDDAFVKKYLRYVQDPVVRGYWEKEMAKTSDFHKSEQLGYMISKVGRFVENGMMRNIIGQSHSGFSFRDVMDNKKILLVNLAKGLVGEINANLLGMIIVSKLQMAALERASLPEEQRNDFYLYIDEFQNFITDSIATILSEARKYRLELVIANQYLNQLVDNKGNKAVRDAVLANTGTIAAFRIGTEDADVLSKEFAPVFGAYDLVNVEQYTAYVKMLIDNTAARPFNMMTYPPRPGNKELAAAIKELSRLKYGRPRDVVEAEIMERSQLGAAAPSSSAGLSEASR
jgi:hypothetical protein